MLDRNYGVMLGISYLGYPVAVWGSDSASQAWRNNVVENGYSLDLSLRHYFDDADESSYYMSTYFSLSRLWLSSDRAPNDIFMRKERIAIMLGYQKNWRGIYFDLSGGLGVKFKNWRTQLTQLPINGNRISPEYDWGLGWSFDFRRSVTTIAVPIELLVGFCFINRNF